MSSGSRHGHWNTSTSRLLSAPYVAHGRTSAREGGRDPHRRRLQFRCAHPPVAVAGPPSPCEDEIEENSQATTKSASKAPAVSSLAPSERVDMVFCMVIITRVPSLKGLKFFHELCQERSGAALRSDFKFSESRYSRNARNREFQCGRIALCRSTRACA